MQELVRRRRTEEERRCGDGDIGTSGRPAPVKAEGADRTSPRRPSLPVPYYRSFVHRAPCKHPTLRLQFDESTRHRPISLVPGSPPSPTRLRLKANLRHFQSSRRVGGVKHALYYSSSTSDCLLIAPPRSFEHANVLYLVWVLYLAFLDQLLRLSGLHFKMPCRNRRFVRSKRSPDVFASSLGRS